MLIPTAPAILNAIRHATGVLVTKVPATPARIRAAIRDKEHLTVSHGHVVRRRHGPGRGGLRPRRWPHLLNRLQR